MNWRFIKTRVASSAFDDWAKLVLAIPATRITNSKCFIHIVFIETKIQAAEKENLRKIAF